MELELRMAVSGNTMVMAWGRAVYFCDISTQCPPFRVTRVHKTQHDIVGVALFQSNLVVIEETPTSRKLKADSLCAACMLLSLTLS